MSQSSLKGPISQHHDIGSQTPNAQTFGTFRPYDQQKHTDRDKTLPRSLQGLTEQRHSGATKEVVHTTDCCELCDIPPVPIALNPILYIVLGYFSLL